MRTNKHDRASKEEVAEIITDLTEAAQEAWEAGLLSDEVTAAIAGGIADADEAEIDEVKVTIE